MATQSITESTATFKVVSKDRKLFKVQFANVKSWQDAQCFMHEPTLMDCEINESNSSWKVGEIVGFVGTKIKKSSKYGSTIRFIPTVEKKVEENGAIWVEVEEFASEVIEAKKEEKVLTPEEKELKNQFSRACLNGLSELNNKIVDKIFLEISEKFDSETVEWAKNKILQRNADHIKNSAYIITKKSDMKASFEKRYAAKAASTTKSFCTPSYDFRVLYADSQDAPVKKGYVMTGRGKSFRISEDHPSYEGSHLLGYEGDLGSYAYYKKAEKKDKKAVMTRAWVIAREAQAKFGGKASQYLSGALKASWAE